ncbi:MAG TPA: hypothetical protein VGV37_27480 [Aliidongia sp.]|uniref:hypothetical protein n=1 Tax=Aliidongia sp. TaxID=1914230 RepID=UPI002DDD9508|nr:hypothetical protein [Aliidongia sp.]HEV2678300.1 hypothetical protein [Aliidongia sp.]
MLMKLCRSWQETSDQIDAICDVIHGLRTDAAAAVPMPDPIRQYLIPPATFDGLPRVRRDRFDLVNRRNELADLVAHSNGLTPAATTSLQEEAQEIAGILAAIEAYDIEIAAERTRNGHDEASAQHGRLVADRNALREQISRTPAASVAGLAAKLHLLDCMCGYSYANEGDEDFFAAELVRDAARLADLPACLAFAPREA